MEYVHSLGYPVPEVVDVSADGTELVMERVTGPTMIEAASAQSWKLRRYGRDLAQLHKALHLLAAPEWLPCAPGAPGDRVLHMDLHPLNVILSPRGPVVIDWTNAARGDPCVDVAATWILLSSADVAGTPMQVVKVALGRGILLRAFLGAFSTRELSSQLGEVIDWKCEDPHMSATELRRIRSLLPGAE